MRAPTGLIVSVALAAGFVACTRQHSGGTGACPDPPVPPLPVPASAQHPGSRPPLPLAVRGRDIVDAAGSRFRIAGASWYGAEQSAHVAGGLDVQKLPTIVAQVRAAGLNTIRLPWSDDLVQNDALYTVSCAAVAANPEFAGKHPMEVFDAVVGELTRHGVLVVLDNHVSDATWCCPPDENALWHNDRWPESAWLAHWQQMAARYAANEAVVGADIRNEPRPGPRGAAVWSSAPGQDPGTDWPSAAERADRAIHQYNEDLLTIVEGIDLGSSLTGVVTRPLDIPANRLVYSAHSYEFSPSHNYDPADPKVLEANLDRSWGFLLDGYTDPAGVRHGPVPVLVGEFGCNAPATPGIGTRADACWTDVQGAGGAWYTQFHRYLQKRDLDWIYWPLNGTYAAGPIAGVTCPTGPAASLDPWGPQAACWGMPEHYGILTPDWTSPKPSLRESLRMLIKP